MSLGDVTTTKREGFVGESISKAVWRCSPKTVHGATTQTLHLLHSLQVVLLVNVHTHHCAAPSSIVQRQLTTNAMSGARNLERIKLFIDVQIFIAYAVRLQMLSFPTYQHYLAADVLLLSWQHSLCQCDQQLQLNAREQHQKLQQIL